MALGDVNQIVFSSGQLCLSPVNNGLTGTFPFGGTALGLIRNTVATVRRKTVPIREEPFGCQLPYDILDVGEAWVLTGNFRTYDSDVVNTVFASVVTGGSTAAKAIFYPNLNTYRTGTLLSAKGVKLLLAPDDVENQRFLYAYNAVAITDEDAKLPFQRGEEWVVPFKFILLPNASNNTVAMALREDLQSLWTAYGQ